jgi:hypothetical protein
MSVTVTLLQYGSHDQPQSNYYAVQLVSINALYCNSAYLVLSFILLYSDAIVHVFYSTQLTSNDTTHRMQYLVSAILQATGLLHLLAHAL